MRTQEAKRLIALAIKRVTKEASHKPLMNIRTQTAIHSQLYKEMKGEGMHVSKINGDIELVDIQTEFEYLYDDQCKPLSSDDIKGVSGRFKNEAHKLFHLTMITWNYEPDQYDPIT